MYGPAGSCKTHALLDLGSQVTLVTEGLSDRLGISGPVDNLVLSTINGSERLRSRRVSFAIEPVTSSGTRHEIRNAQTTPTLNVSSHTIDWSREKCKWSHLADLDLPSGTQGPVEVLLGTDVIELIVPRDVIEGPPGTPCAVRTLLGWTVTGRAPGRNLPDDRGVHHARVTDENSALIELQNQVKQFWTTERPRDEETAETRVTACATGGAEPAINPSRFSSWLRLLRVTAWVRRFAHNSRRATADRRTGPLTAEELREAERVWLLSAQGEQFSDEIAALQHGRRLPSNSRLHQLTPFLDSNGLLRVGGRLRHAHLDFEVKHQVILPARGDITRLIVTDRHKKLAHSGAEHVLTHLRQQFWVICGRAAVKRYTRACMLCRKRTARPAPPLMGDLPAFRVGEPAPVFARVGVDFFGPLMVKKQRKREKRYGCLFTCLSTRAVHIELAHSLDTDSFIMAMRRMMARRGNVSLVCSDNGTNFRAGERELRQALQQWNQTKIADTLSQEGVEWRFNPPGAPHFGGVFERLVRSAKRALTTVLGDRAVDDETLRTVVTEVEALLNGRPLTYISTDPDDYQPLTPNHFLIGRASPQLPPGVFVDGDLCGRRRWKHTQVLIDHIWRRWRREYLPTLTTRAKWRTDTAGVQLGELVLVTDDNLPRGHWPVGRVVSVFRGADDRVRVVEVATAAGRYRRPVSRLCRLECDGEGQ